MSNDIENATELQAYSEALDKAFAVAPDDDQVRPLSPGHVEATNAANARAEALIVAVRKAAYKYHAAVSTRCVDSTVRFFKAKMDEALLELAQFQTGSCMDPVHQAGGKWFFWDELWSDELGPYDNEIDCRAGLAEYVRMML